MRFTLTWDTSPSDLDLHVVLPDGSLIHGLGPALEGGIYEFDGTRGPGPENVYWPATAVPPAGTYSICAIPYSITVPTNYTLTSVKTGTSPKVSQGLFLAGSSAPAGTLCSAASPYVVTTFVYP